jgi:DNA primase
MTEIDLTPATEAAARTLFAEDLADRCVRRLPDTATAEEKQETHDYFIDYALLTWDSGKANQDEVLRYRKLALAAIGVMWKDVARQAWEHCRNTIHEQTMHTGTFWMGNLSNPYKEGNR